MVTNNTQYITIIQSPKFKRVLLNETPKFPFLGLNICVDFDLRGSKKMENMKKMAQYDLCTYPPQFFSFFKVYAEMNSGM